jgi:phosphohistidine phosphatase SixA
MSVTLTLMRHGIAEPFAPSDTERALTPRGREQVSAVAAWLTAPAGGRASSSTPRCCAPARPRRR